MSGIPKSDGCVAGCSGKKGSGKKVPGTFFRSKATRRKMSSYCALHDEADRIRRLSMPKSDRKLRACTAKRDLGKELLQSVREMKADKRGRVHKVKGHRQGLALLPRSF